MWLFDNIFLDQDTPTAMLDPLLTDDQKKQRAETEKKQSDAWKAEALTEAPEVQAENPLDTVSFDNIATTPTTAEDTSSAWFLGGPQTATTSEEVSFDIWGFDIPAFGEATEATDTVATWTEGGTFLSGGAPVASEEVSFLDGASVAPESTDASIALVQGATSASSDAIIDIWGTMSPDAIQITGESSTLVSIGMPETTTEEVSISEPVEAVDNTLLDMLSSGEAPIAEVTPGVTIEDTVPETPVVEDTVSIIPTGEIPESTEPVLNMSFPETISSTSDSEALVDTLTASVPFSPDSPLHEMLTEFIAKLEKFNTESSTLDIEMAASEAALKKEQEDLQMEYETRLRAIDYKRKHIDQTRSERRGEKTRLEKIIKNLKEEVV